MDNCLKAGTDKPKLNVKMQSVSDEKTSTPCSCLSSKNWHRGLDISFAVTVRHNYIIFMCYP